MHWKGKFWVGQVENPVFTVIRNMFFRHFDSNTACKTNQQSTHLSLVPNLAKRALFPVRTHKADI